MAVLGGHKSGHGVTNAPNWPVYYEEIMRNGQTGALFNFGFSPVHAEVVALIPIFETNVRNSLIFTCSREHVL